MLGTAFFFFSIMHNQQYKIIIKLHVNGSGQVGQVWHLIVSIPDLCTLTYLEAMHSGINSGISCQTRFKG